MDVVWGFPIALQKLWLGKKSLLSNNRRVVGLIPSSSTSHVEHVVPEQDTKTQIPPDGQSSTLYRSFAAICPLKSTIKVQSIYYSRVVFLTLFHIILANVGLMDTIKDN